MALFGELGYQLTERWQVTVGARWFDYDDQLVLETSFPFFDTVLNDTTRPATTTPSSSSTHRSSSRRT